MTTLRQYFIVVAAFVLLSPIAAHAQTLTVVWDPNSSADQVTSYTVCIGTTSSSCNFREASVPANQNTYQFTPSAGVLYYVAVRAISAAGAGPYSQEITVSTPLLSQPANRTSTVNQPISPLSLSATDPDGDTLQYSHTGLPFGLSLNPTTGAITGTPTSTGTFNVSVFVADDLVTTSQSFVWTIVSGAPSDTVDPSLSITSHTPGQTVTTSTITFAGTASDGGRGDSGITSVTINGVAANGGTASGSGTANWSRVVGLATGANDLTVVATDGAGNSVSTQITINRTSTAVDTTAPTLVITSHTPGQTVTATNITLTGTATDSGTGNSGISRVHVNGSLVSGATTTGSGTVNWSRNVPLALGANLITVVAADGAENNRTVQITITRLTSDTAAPAVQVTSHTSGQTVTTANITLAGTASDGSGGGNSGIASVRVNGQTASGGTATGNATANWSRSVSLAPGANTITVAATDGAGNARSVSLTVIYDAPILRMTGASLSQNVPSPQPSGSTITFTASGSGGTAPYQYQWYVQMNGGAWTMLRQWNTADTYAWTAPSAGTFVIAIWARSSGATANVWEAYAERTIVINPAQSPSGRMTSGTLSVNVLSPQTTGTPITFTASGTGGRAPYEYQWYLQKDGGVWQLLRTWSTTTTYTWTPTQSGSYMMAIWARSSGSTANAWEAYAERAFTINAPSGGTPPTPPPPSAPSLPMTSAALSTNAGSPQATGTTVTFSASGTGGTAPYEYQWYLQKDGGVWQLLRAWSTTTTYTWTPTQSGSYMMAIWARSSGSTANAWQAYAERAFTINAPSGGTPPTTPPPPPSAPSLPMTSAALSTNMGSPQATGTTVTFSASGTGGTAPYEYQWYLQKDGGVWQLLRAWSTTTTYSWTPTQPGSYMMAVWARSAGSTANAWQAYAERSFSVTSGGGSASVSVPMTAATLAFDRPSGQKSGTTITAMAAGTGGTAPYEFQWYAQRNGGAWYLVRQWSTDSTLAWTPPLEGQYVIAVWARSSGSTANAWQAYAEQTFLVVP